MNDIKYVVKVHGKAVSPPVDSPALAENYIKQLQPVHQELAEIVQVTNTGKEMLFG